MKTEKPCRITLLYHSGTGGTRLVAELIGELLSPTCAVRIHNIHSSAAMESVPECDLLVFCFPTYYLKPSPSMSEFITGLPRFDSLQRAYIVATAEVYTENCVRACALSLKDRGITVVGSAVFHAPGSDVTCVVPARFCRWLYRFEKRFPRKLQAVAGEISRLAFDRYPRQRIPAFKWYTPLTQLLQVLVLNRFDAWKRRIRILSDRCIACGVCVAECERGAWRKADGELHHESERCEFCTRCIHRCPRNAIVLFAWLKDNPRLDRALYARLGEETRNQLGSLTPE